MSDLIKGYLPIQLSLPSPSGEGSENTFIFVKQHTGTAESSSRTLFVTNTPIYPSIQTKIIIQCLFEKYADVEKILVAPKPKKDVEEEGETSAENLTMKLFEKEIRSFGADKAVMDKESWCDQGRYAHVIFKTAKDLKKFIGHFRKTKKGGDKVVRFGKLEIQELQDISLQLFTKHKREWCKHGDISDSGDDSSDQEEDKPTGIMALVKFHQDKIMPRETLKLMCDQIMEKYEEDEEEALRRQQETSNQPDDDGFVTVSYSTNVGDAVEFEKNGTLGSTGSRRKRERSRSTKNNLVKGSDNLQDFYRFQMKDSKKRGLDELKNRFQEDLKRVKQMKDDRMYRPF
jgi:ribosomal RNA-processing protein 7